MAPEPLEHAWFCHSFGSPVNADTHAECKQVTVLFADVVRSMDIASSVGAERLREIMAELVEAGGSGNLLCEMMLAGMATRAMGGTVSRARPTVIPRSPAAG